MKNPVVTIEMINGDTIKHFATWRVNMQIDMTEITQRD